MYITLVANQYYSLKNTNTISYKYKIKITYYITIFLFLQKTDNQIISYIIIYLLMHLCTVFSLWKYLPESSKGLKFEPKNHQKQSQNHGWNLTPLDGLGTCGYFQKVCFFPPKSSHLFIGFSIINHPFWGTSIFGNTHVFVFKQNLPGLDFWIRLGRLRGNVWCRRLEAVDFTGYLEDGLPVDGSVVNNHGDHKSPKDRATWDPFQMAELYGLLIWGDPN